MTPAEARLIIKNRFSEREEPDAWWHQQDCDTYLGLFDLLVLTMPAEDALGILGQAYGAAANEFGA